MEQKMAQQLQKLERIQIQTLLETGRSIDAISVYLGRHRSTIYREMHRVDVSRKDYQAERFHRRARKNMARQIKVSPFLGQFFALTKKFFSSNSQLIITYNF